jgi:hypothetical protein
MKHLLNSAIKAMMILGIVFVMGLFIPMLIISFTILFSSATYEGIIGGSDGDTFAFWFFTVIGWIYACLYINDELRKVNNTNS